MTEHSEYPFPEKGVEAMSQFLARREARAVREAFFALSHLDTEGGRRHVGAGVAFRIEMLAECRIRLEEVCLREHEESLGSEDAVYLGTLVNAFYLLMRGGLDNLAWALIYELQLLPKVDEDNGSTRNLADLASRKLIKAVKEKRVKLAKELVGYHPWLKELKAMRDPIAHRIPLRIVRGVLNEEETARWHHLRSEASTAFEEDDVATYMEKMRDSRRLGRFLPIMQHPTSKGLYYISSTVAHDQALFLDLVLHVVGSLGAQPVPAVEHQDSPSEDGGRRPGA